MITTTPAQVLLVTIVVFVAVGGSVLVGLIAGIHLERRHQSEDNLLRARMDAYHRDKPLTAWSNAVPPGGVVCAVPMPGMPDGICGYPVESEPCPEHPAKRRFARQFVAALARDTPTYGYQRGRRDAYSDGYDQGLFDSHMDAATGYDAHAARAEAYGEPTEVYDHETEGL